MFCKLIINVLFNSILNSDDSKKDQDEILKQLKKLTEIQEKIFEKLLESSKQLFKKSKFIYLILPREKTKKDKSKKKKLYIKLGTSCEICLMKLKQFDETQFFCYPAINIFAKNAFLKKIICIV